MEDRRRHRSGTYGCCILTGAGGYFCAGHGPPGRDRPPAGEGDSFRDGSYDRRASDALLRPATHQAADRGGRGKGHAAGTESAVRTDIRIASKAPKLGISEGQVEPAVFRWRRGGTGTGAADPLHDCR